MELLYFKVEGGNFGDDLNDWIWDRLLPGWKDWPVDAVLVGVGTILKQEFLPEGRRKLVLGSGIGYGKPADTGKAPEEWDIRCVRGPHTAAALGLPTAMGIVDPAMLIADLSEFSDVTRSEETLFVPHHVSDGNFDWKTICTGTGITPISPAQDAHLVIRRIAGARRVIAESMHAAIIADAFRVPWQPVAVTRSFNHFKWADWGDSIGADVTAQRFFPLLRRFQAVLHGVRQAISPAPPASPQSYAPRHADPEQPAVGLKYKILEHSARAMLKRVAERPFRLSDQAMLDTRKARLRDVLKAVERDYAG